MCTTNARGSNTGVFLADSANEKPRFCSKRGFCYDRLLRLRIQGEITRDRVIFITVELIASVCSGRSSCECQNQFIMITTGVVQVQLSCVPGEGVGVSSTAELIRGEVAAVSEVKELSTRSGLIQNLNLMSPQAQLLARMAAQPLPA